MNTTAKGAQAEQAVAAMLTERGMDVLARNWKRRRCEIDIVARDPGGVVRFVEVRYRADESYGSGSESVTPRKAAQLLRAAAFWMQEHREPAGYAIDIASVTGSGSYHIEYLPDAVRDEV